VNTETVPFVPHMLPKKPLVMVTTRRVNSIRDCALKTIERQGFAWAANHFEAMGDTLNGGEIITATGRATCRSCGQRLAKGEKAIRFYEDQGGGSWTALCMQIHFDHCEPVPRSDK
jgi:hypothetical protein